MVDASPTLPARTVDQLRRALHGDVITPADGSYDDARRLWNALHDRRPAAIVRPRDASEVATAIGFGRDHGLEITVRSGGHSLAGLTGHAGGLVVDLSLMRGVDVDPDRRIARANGGALLGELDVAAQAHGLVCPVGVVGHTGVTGLTLVAAWDACSGSSASRSTTSLRSSWSRPTGGSCGRARRRSRSCSGASTNG